MKSIVNTTIKAILILLAIDFVCFLGWALSGQHPADNFYFGTISAHLIGAILN